MQKDSVLIKGNWKFRFDMDWIADTERWFDKSHSKDTWRTVKVPGAVDFYGPEYRNFEGVAWFAVDIPKRLLKPGKWQRIRFSRVFDTATVWVNGKEAGKNECGYLPFEIDLTPFVRAGEDAHLVLKVDNRVDPGRLPGSRVVEWIQYGGIHEAPELITTSSVFISHVHVNARPDGQGANLKCSVGITNRTKRDAIGKLRLIIKKGKTESDSWIDYSCKALGQAEVQCDLRLTKAELWSPENPVLYKAVAELEKTACAAGKMEIAFGVRSVETKGSQILLNGKPVMLKGFCRYDDFPGCAWTLTKAQVMKDLTDIKKCGANFVRVHYPQSQDFYDAMDKIGLLLMQELPLNWWRTEWWGKYEEQYQNMNVIDKAEVVLEKMIHLRSNHPCIIAWSMANESRTDDELGIAAMNRLMAKTRQLDPTRLALFVVAGNVRGHLASADADAVCPNVYWGLFHGTVAKNISEIEENVYQATKRDLVDMVTQYPGKPLIVTEFGTHSLHGVLGSKRASEEYQARYLEAVWKAISEVKGVCGGSAWCWADYPHRRGFLGAWPSDYGPYGVVTYGRKPKKSYHALKKIWTAKK